MSAEQFSMREFQHDPAQTAAEIALRLFKQAVETDGRTYTGEFTEEDALRLAYMAAAVGRDMQKTGVINQDKLPEPELFTGFEYTFVEEAQDG